MGAYLTVDPGADQNIYLVLDNLGHRLGRAWVETDEEHAELLRHLMEGQFHNPARIVCFNTDERWSRDASEEIADELQQRCAERGEIPRSPPRISTTPR